MFFDSKRAFGENCERTVADGVGSPKVSIFARRTRCVCFHLLLSSVSVFVRDARRVRCACFRVRCPSCPLRLRALLILRADQQLSGLSGFFQATR